VIIIAYLHALSTISVFAFNPLFLAVSIYMYLHFGKNYWRQLFTGNYNVRSESHYVMITSSQFIIN